MKLSLIVDKSAYCSIGCITKESDLDTLEEYLLYNFPVISKFPKIIVSHTKTDNISNELELEYKNIWIKTFGNEKCSVNLRPNFGHTFGFVDLDNSVLKKSKEMGFDYTWKSTNDVLITDQIFDVEMDDSNFFYLQGHGIAGIKNYYNMDLDLAINSFSDIGYKNLFPQTNFFITTNKTTDLIEQEYFDEQYNKFITDPDYNKNSSLEYKYMMAEIILRDFMYKNNLKSKHLISKNSYKNLINAIVQYNIVDSSHKNVFFTECGVCHYHFKNESVIEL